VNTFEAELYLMVQLMLKQLVASTVWNANASAISKYLQNTVKP
jgi:hypothetical protein